MADDYGIQLEAAITRKLWYPSMLEIEETACSYGSYVGIPSIKESGGHMMAADMKKVNEDQVLDSRMSGRTPIRMEKPWHGETPATSDSIRPNDSDCLLRPGHDGRCDDGARTTA